MSASESNSNERGIISRFLFAATASIALLFCAGVLGYVLWLERITVERNEASKQYLEGMWIASRGFYSQLLQHQTRIFTRSDETRTALAEHDVEQLRRLHDTTYNLLWASGVASSIELMDAEGRVLFARHARGDDLERAEADLTPDSLLKRALHEGRVVVALDSNIKDNPHLALALPLYRGSGYVVGAVYLAQALETLLDKIARSTGVVAAIWDNDGHVSASSDSQLTDALFAALPFDESLDARADVELDGRIWQRVVAPLEVMPNGHKLYLATFADVTNAVHRAKRAALFAGAIVLAGLMLALAMIYRAVVHAGLRAHASLESQVSKRTAELVIARDQALVAERVMSTFLSNMSHELRTPLHGVLSYAQLGIAKKASASAEKLGDYFLEIKNSGTRLLAVLDNLIDLSRLQRGNMGYEYREDDVCEIVRKVVDEIRPLAREKELALAITGDASIVLTLDKRRIAQVLYNLLANAVKFSSMRGGIEIDVIRTPAGAAQITVSDHGVGIPEGELETIFSPFVESSVTRNKAGGTGIGLTICREIVEKGHKGRIVAGNRDGGGARFTVTIPATQTAIAAA